MIARITDVNTIKRMESVHCCGTFRDIVIIIAFGENTLDKSQLKSILQKYADDNDFARGYENGFF